MPQPNEIIKNLSPRVHHILNLRLTENAPALSILYWMNNDPEIREVLDERFSRARLTEKDLADWDILRKAALFARPVSPITVPPKGPDAANPTTDPTAKPRPAQQHPAPTPQGANDAPPTGHPKPVVSESAASHSQTSNKTTSEPQKVNPGGDALPARPNGWLDSGRGVPPLVAAAAPNAQPAQALPFQSDRVPPPLAHAAPPTHPAHAKPSSHDAVPTQPNSSLIACARALSKEATAIAATGLCAERLLLVITTRYAELLQGWESAQGTEWSQRAEIHFNRRLIVLQDLSKAAIALRKCEQQDARLALDRERLELLREKQRSKSPSSAPFSPASSSPETSPAPQTASVSNKGPSDHRLDLDASSAPASMPNASKGDQ